MLQLTKHDCNERPTGFAGIHKEHGCHYTRYESWVGHGCVPEDSKTTRYKGKHCLCQRKQAIFTSELTDFPPKN